MSARWWVAFGLVALASVLLRENLLFLLSLFLLLIGVVSSLWARVCLVGVTYRRQFGAQRLYFGEETDLTIEIVNAKALPLAWLRAEDEFPSSLALNAGKLAVSYRPGRSFLVNLLSLRWYERVTRRYRVRGTRRGAWRFGPVRISSGDIFGFALQREDIDDTATLLVYPKIIPVTNLGLPASRPFGDLRTPRRTIEDPLRFMGAREYVSGDSYRHIHWKATARRQALQTKVFEPSAAMPVAVFLNINTYESLIEGRDFELQEYAISAAASLACWAAENGHPVGLYVNSLMPPGAQRIRIRPSSRPDQLLLVLDALAKVVEHGPWSIESVLQAEGPQLLSGASIVVISATANTRLQHTMLDLRARGYGMTFVTLGDHIDRLDLPSVQHYHIGGREAWRELASLPLA